jgi:hypothetical protein
MRRVLLSLSASMVLLGSLMVPAYSNAGGEPHPLLRRAFNALQNAKGDLQNAAHDYCGHRLDALGATNEAIGQLDQALGCEAGGGKKKTATDVEFESAADPSWVGGGEPHPRIYNAINALGAAEGDLQNAAHDYCGHRAAALRAVQNALNQLKAAVACDKK